MFPNASLPFPAALSGMANRALKVSSWMASRSNHYFPFSRMQGLSDPCYLYNWFWLLDLLGCVASHNTSHPRRWRSTPFLDTYSFCEWHWDQRIPADLQDYQRPEFLQDQKLERISYIGPLLALRLDLFCKPSCRFDIWMFEHLAFLHFANIILLELWHVYGICNFTLPNPSRTMLYQFTLQMEKF